MTLDIFCFDVPLIFSFAFHNAFICLIYLMFTLRLARVLPAQDDKSLPFSIRFASWLQTIELVSIDRTRPAIS